MEKFKTFIKTKKGKVSIAVVLVLVMITSIGGVYVYDENVKKTKILNAMNVTFKEEIKINEFEYGSTIEVKNLIKVENGEVKKYPKIDTTKLGEQILEFTVTKDKYLKKFEQKIKVIDTKAPEITFEADVKEIMVGDEYDVKSNITSVKDIVDGDIALVEDAKTINGKATEEYKKLTKVDFKEDTKIADKTIADFVIVDAEKEESDKVLFLKNTYYIDGSVDTATAGDYIIKVVAVDKNGIKSEKEFTVNVKEKLVEPIPQVNGGNTGDSYSNTGGGSIPAGGGNTTASVPKGKDWMISYAIGKIGQAYPTCQSFVDDVLHSSGYLSASQPNFAYGGYSINWQDLGPGDVLATTTYNGIKHVRIITSYPTINDYGTYTWNTVEGGLGSPVIAASFQHSPSSSISMDYVLRY